MQFAPVYSSTSLIASDIAKMRIRLVQMDRDGIWQEIENPAYSPVLRKPNHYQTRIEFIQHWVLSKLNYGNAYILKERDSRGIVTAMYVLNPQWIRLLVAERGDVYCQIQRDDLAGQHKDTVNIPARDIIHDKMNTLFHPLVGISPIYACGLSAVQGLQIRHNSADFFANGARPIGILKAPDEIDDVTADRLKLYWQDNFSGQNAGKIAVMGDGLKYEPMMMTSVDAQMIEQLKMTSEPVCSVFHVPASMVGLGRVEYCQQHREAAADILLAVPADPHRGDRVATRRRPRTCAGDGRIPAVGYRVRSRRSAADGFRQSG